MQYFAFGGPNGANPMGGMIADASGNFYGTTYNGGSANLGVVYEMSPAPTGAAEAVLYNFSGNGDGANPIGDLVFDSAGNLYGVTQYGGTASQGTVFELSPPASQGDPWTETVLYSFQGGASDGAQPVAGLVFDSGGSLYGTTSLGGIDGFDCNSGCGTAFELSPSATPGGVWTENVLYIFQSFRDGGVPMGPLVFDHVGNLYGTTYGGGFEGGTIFELSPPSQPGGQWGEAILHRFIRSEGIAPQAGLAFDLGALFGITTAGGKTGQGTVFTLQPPSVPGGNWTLAVIYDLIVPANAGSGVTIGNPHTLYAIVGRSDATTLLRISDAGGPVVVTTTELPGPEKFPDATLAIYNGALYGTSSGGGYLNNGTVFKLSH